MGGHSFPEIPCIICSKPVDLTVDLIADENGGPVHEHCYVKRTKASSNRGWSRYYGRITSKETTNNKSTAKCAADRVPPVRQRLQRLRIRGI